MKVQESPRRRMRMAFLGVMAWLSVCLLVVGLFPQQIYSLGGFWTIAGLFGLVSSVGLSEAIKSEVRAQENLLATYVNEARTDALTGLGNRRAFDAKLEHWETRWQEGEDFSLLLIDVDHFKKFNDNFGHQAGDEMLRGVAEVLKEKTKGIGSAMRYGGEEFAVTLPGFELHEAQTIAEALRDLVASHAIHFRAMDLNVTVSIGLAQARKSDTAKELFLLADNLLYAAKNAGRNRVRWNLDKAESATAECTA